MVDCFVVRRFGASKPLLETVSKPDYEAFIAKLKNCGKLIFEVIHKEG